MNELAKKLKSKGVKCSIVKGKPKTVVTTQS